MFWSICVIQKTLFNNYFNMNQNNNPQYTYEYRNAYSSQQPKIPEAQSNSDSPSYQIPEQPKMNSSTLLPYHQYMALQKNSNPAQSPNAQRNTTQTYAQQMPNYPQPYYKSPNAGYQMPAYNQLPGQFNRYYPYQPQTYYYPQPLPNVYASKVQNHGIYENIKPMEQTLNKNIVQTANPSLTPNTQQGNNKQRPNSEVSVQKERKAYVPPASKPNQYQIQQNRSQKYENRQSIITKQQRIKKQQHQDENVYMSSNEDWSQEDEQQQFLYQRYQSRRNNYSQNKTKQINKKKDPILDDPEEIKKWVQARKKNYPGLNKKAIQQINEQNHSTPINQNEKQEMSRLQSKIRKKLLIVNGDSRSIMKKIKNIELLRRIIQDPKVLKREKKSKHFEPKPKIIDPIPSKLQALEDSIAQQPILKQILQMPRKAEQPIEEQNSQSNLSEQPLQLPVNKFPKQQIILEDNQEGQLSKVKQIELNPTLFEFVQKEISLPHNQQSPSTNQGRKEGKVLDPETIIAHLKQKQQQDRESLNSLFDYKSNSYSYNYRVQTLQTSLKLDQIFAQTTYLLQAIRYITKENFFEDENTKK